MLVHIFTPAFVGRFTAEALPHYVYKHIEEDLQEWERNLCKVNGSSVRKEYTSAVIVASKNKKYAITYL